MVKKTQVYAVFVFLFCYFNFYTVTMEPSMAPKYLKY